MKKMFKFLLVAAMMLAVSEAGAQAIARHGSDDFRIGIAGYTFRKFDTDSTLKMYQIAGVKYMSVKNFHLPLNSTTEQMDAFKKKCAQYGVECYAVGPINMKTAKDVDEAFDYAVRFGATLMIAIPAYDLLPQVERKVKETGIRVAIHTHGPTQSIWEDCETAMKYIGKLDNRIGICIDLGHTFRYGKNPAKDLVTYKDRIFDIHIKDITLPTKEGKDVPMGRGGMDYKAIVEALRKTGYKGVCSLEYERDPEAPFFGVLESIGYFRGVCDGTAR